MVAFSRCAFSALQNVKITELPVGISDGQKGQVKSLIGWFFHFSGAYPLR